MAAQNKHGLGRGLEALFGDDDFDFNAEISGQTTETPKQGVKTIMLEKLVAGKFQPRRVFNAEAIEALAESIKEKGVLQPILVRKSGDKYEIIAGECRFRAARAAGLTEVPVIEKDLADNEVLEVALIENVVRQDLTPIEEAAGFDRLMKEFSYTQEQLSKVAHKSRSYIANSLRLLNLPQNVQEMINCGTLSAGHARTLVGLENAEALAAQIVKQGLSVRQTEDLIGRLKNQKADTSAPKEKLTKDQELQLIEKELSEKFGLKVQINSGKNGKGKIIFSYNDISELESIIDKLEQ